MEKSRPSEQIKVTPAPVVVAEQYNSGIAPAGMNSDFPVQTTCPACQKQVVTQISYSNGLLTWICVIVIVIVFFPLFWAPLCINSCKDVEHYCPSCGTLIGMKKRL